MSGFATNGLTFFQETQILMLARRYARYLDLPLGGAKVKTFSDGEIQIEIDENVRSKDIFLIQSTCSPVNDNLVELLLMIDAFKRSSARRITAVMPYFGYARQDKKVAPRVPISAKLVADLHYGRRRQPDHYHGSSCRSDSGFFQYSGGQPVCRSGDYWITSKINLKVIIVVVSPDAGGVERARAFAKRLNAGLAIVDKRREAPNKAKAMAVIGDVAGKIAIILDDMVDTAGTVDRSRQPLIMDKGAREVHACCSHPVLSGPAVERIMISPLKSFSCHRHHPLEKRCGCLWKIQGSQHFPPGRGSHHPKSQRGFRNIIICINMLAIIHYGLKNR